MLHDAENDCGVCDAGSFSSSGAGACTTCGGGAYLADAATDVTLHDSEDDCTTCGSGKILVDAATDAHLHDSESHCASCPAGTFLNDAATDASLHDSESDCVVCLAGSFSSSGAGVCTACGSGKFLVDAATDATLHDSESRCNVCLAGSFSFSGAGLCTTCGSGKYLVNAATDASLHDSEGDCVSCPAGTFLSDAATDASLHHSLADCTDCVAGRYSKSLAAPSCVDCAAGRTSVATAATLESTCTTCDGGKYIAETGGTSCILCPTNTFLADETGDESLHDSDDDCAACPSEQPSSADRMVCGVCEIGTGRSIEEGADRGCAICREGYFSDAADTSECKPCAAGKYGDSTALASPECSGNCERGSYCNVSSTSATETPCPEGNYCAQGVSAPDPCPANFARTCDVPDGELCPDNSVCLSGLCSGLNRTALACDVTDFSLDVCSSLFAAGFRSPGDVGCEPGSSCANFHLVERNVKALYTLNQVDVLVEVLALVSTSIFIVANQGNAPTLSKFMSRLNFYVFMAADLILQTAVMAAAYDSDVDDALGEIEDSLCWDGPTPSVTVAGIADSLQWIKVLGWVELLLVVASIVSAGYDRMIDDDNSESAEETCFARMGVVIAIVMSVLDVVFSLIDFFVFTVEGNDDFDALAKSLKELAGEESAAYKKCILLEEEMVPVWVKSEDNCLHEPNRSNVEGGLSGWAIVLIFMCLLWCCSGFCFVEYRRRNPRVDKERKTSQADIVRYQETELTEVRAQMLQMEESNRRLQEQRRQDAAHLEALKQARLQNDDSVNRRLSSAAAEKEAAEAAAASAVAEKAAMAEEMDILKRQLMTPAAGTQL